MMEFGQALKQLRKRANLSQRDFAVLVDVHFTYISKLENGHYEILPSEDLICRIADVLEADSEELLILLGKFNVKQLEEKTTQHEATARLIRYVQNGVFSEQEIETIIRKKMIDADRRLA